MQTEKLQRYSIRKLSVGASSVLIGLAFMGLNGSKAQAAEVNSNQEQTQTENAGSEKLDATENQVDQTDNTVKTVKPSTNAWGRVQTESVQTDNVNSKQSTPDSSKQDNQKIETNTLKTEKPAQTLNTQALFATSKVSTTNNDLATQTDPAKLSKDDFADGTHWTPAGWTTTSPNTKVAKESMFTYENSDPITFDMSSDFRVLGGRTRISATVDKNDIVKGNKILVAAIQSTKGNKQQNQHLAFTDSGYLNGTENGINFNGQNIGYLHSEYGNNTEVDWYLNVTNTINFATNPKFTFNLNSVGYEFNIPSIITNGVDAGPNYAEGVKDVGDTYYLVTNSQTVPIKVVASKKVIPQKLPDNINYMWSVYNDPAPSSHTNYGGARYAAVSSSQNVTGVEKISAVNTKFDPNSPIGVAFRTIYYTVHDGQMYRDLGLPANNPWNYNKYVYGPVKTVKLANNLSANDVLAQTPENAVSASYQSDGSYITAWNISPDALGSGGKSYVQALAPNGSALNLQLVDHKNDAINDTLNYYKDRNYVPSAMDVLIMLDTIKDKTVNDVVTVTDLSQNSSLKPCVRSYVVNGATFDAELYKTAGVQYIDDVTDKVISKDSITGVRDQDFTYKINIPKGYVLANNSNGSNYRFDNNYQNVIYTFNKDQAVNDKNPITIHLTHGRKAVVDSNTISETIHYVFEDGSKALDDYVAKPVASTRIGHKDLVTGETIWDSDWSTESFNKVAVPKLDGFTPDQTEIDAITVNGESPDIVKTVTYRANNQKIIVKYIDDTTKSVLATKELTGKSNTDAGYNTQDTIKVYVNSGYDLVSDNTQGQVLKFDSKDAVDQNYEVHLKHHISNVTDPKLLNAEFNRVVTEFLPTGKSKELKQYYVITRTGTQDQVTKEYKFSNWSTANVYKDQGDTFDGYTARIQKQTPNGIASLENKVPVVKDEVFTNQNNNSVTPVNINEVVEIVYDANTQKAFVKYIDDTTKKVLATKELTGKTNTDSKYTTQDSIKNYLAKGYDLVSDNTNGKSIIFDSKDAVDQNYEVHLKHHISNVTDPKLLNAEFNRVVTEFLPTGKSKELKQHYVITRTGTQDQVTKEYKFSNWSTVNVHKDQGDTFDGYTAQIQKQTPNGIASLENKVPVVKEEVFTNQNNNAVTPVNADEAVEIVYDANTQKAFVKYIDDTTKKVLATKELTGKTNTDSKYTTQDSIKNYLAKGYDLVIDNTNGKSIIFDSKDAVDQNYEVHLKHHINKVVDPKLLNASFARVIIEHVPKDKDKWISQHYVITRTGTQDQVTKQYTFTDWSKANVYKDLIDNFEGYTASPKGLKVDQFMVKQNGKWSAKAETFTNDRDIINPINLTEVAEIDYVANPQEATIVYYDDTADKVLERNVSHGKFDEAIKFNPEVMTIVKKYQDQHYKLTSNEFDNQTYKSDDKNNIFVVHFVHDTKPETREKTVTETIHYVDSNDQKLHDDVVNSKVFTNKGTRDLVTDTVKWDDLWLPANSTFDKVVSPVIDGYTPDKDTIDTQNVDSNSKDLEFTVHYKKNPKDAKLIKSETFDVKQKGDTKEQKVEENPVVKSNKVETVQPAQSPVIENKVPTGPVNVVYNDEQVVKTNNGESKTTQLTGTMASVLPQTGSNNDNTLAYAGLLLVSLIGLVNELGATKKKRN